MSRKPVQSYAARLGRHEIWKHNATRRTRQRHCSRYISPRAVAERDAERPSRTAQVMLGLLALGVLVAPFVDTALRAPVRRRRDEREPLPGFDTQRPLAMRPLRELLQAAPRRDSVPPVSTPPLLRTPPVTTACAPLSTPRPCVETLNLSQAVGAPPEVQSILWGWRWRQCDWNSCGKVLKYRPEAPSLAVQFADILDAPRSYYAHSFGQDTVPMDAESQDVVRRSLAEIERFANIKHREVTAGVPSNVYYAQTGHRPAAGQANVDGNERSWATTMDNYGHDLRVSFHETGHVHGLSHTRNEDHGGPGGMTPYFLPEAGWPDDSHSSVMSYNDVPIDGYGPLDLAALAFLYGTAPALRGDTVHVLDANTGRRGWHDDDGDNTLAARHRGRVYLDLNTRAASASVIGDSWVQLSPTSRFVTGDLSAAQGGVLRGNALNNRLIGSNRDDIIASGSGQATITTGAGSDTVVLEAGAQVTVTDYDSGRDKLATTSSTPGPIGKTVQAAPAATVVQFPGGERSVLLGVSPDAVDVGKIVRSYTIPGPGRAHSGMRLATIIGIAVGTSVGSVLLCVAGCLCGAWASARRRAAAVRPGSPVAAPALPVRGSLLPLAHERPMHLLFPKMYKH